MLPFRKEKFAHFTLDRVFTEGKTGENTGNEEGTREFRPNEASVPRNSPKKNNFLKIQNFSKNSIYIFFRKWQLFGTIFLKIQF